MDTKLALERVQEYLSLLKASRVRHVEAKPDADREDELKRKLPLIEAIEDGMYPGPKPALRPQYIRGWAWADVRERVLTLEGALTSADEVQRILGPRGPRLDAVGLHPWVWEAAARAWDDGHRRGAIQAAATQVDQQLKAKLNRFDVSGTVLAGQAFSLDPPQVGKPRLRMPGHPRESPEFRSRQQGALHFGQGCMEGIRNISTHLSKEPEEQVALEQLAALSVLARWIDEAEVETVPVPSSP